MSQVDDYQHATQLLRTAGMRVKLSVSSGALPKGWSAHTDRDGCAYYLHKEQRLKTRSHPSVVNKEIQEMREMSEDMDGEEME